MRALFERYKMIITYFSHSVLSTLLDSAIVWILLSRLGIDIVWANTCGVVTGFVLGFLLDVKRTFRSDYSLTAFAVYFGTFLLGLGLANALIKATYDLLGSGVPQFLAFLVSKGVSVVVPFFAMYFIRKYAYKAIGKRNRDE